MINYYKNSFIKEENQSERKPYDQSVEGWSQDKISYFLELAKKHGFEASHWNGPNTRVKYPHISIVWTHDSKDFWNEFGEKYK